jgi:serine/threonine protein kinase
MKGLKEGTMQTCIRCGYAQNRDQARFCARCGGALTAATAAPAGSVAPGLELGSSLGQGRYQIIHRIAPSSLGAVYEAADTHIPGKRWAIKEMLPEDLTDPAERQQAVAACRHEFEQLARLSHPNLPKMADFIEEAGKIYLVMDFVDGQTLEQILAATPGNLVAATVLDWARQLCSVLEYLNTRQPPIFFRDLRPANIMLGKDGLVKLIDWGLGRFFAPRVSLASTASGVMGYAAPEQFGGGAGDARSEVYSLGVTLHRLLTRYDPAITPSNLPSPRSINPQITPEIEAVIARATRFAPAERFQSLAEMSRALGGGGGAVAGVAPLPTPAGWEQRPPVADSKLPEAGGTRRRSPWKWALGLSIGVIACLGISALLLMTAGPTLLVALVSPTPTASATLTASATPTSTPVPPTSTPTPTATATSTSTATSTATSTPLPTLTPTRLPDAVALAGAVLRTGPGLAYDFIADIQTGNVLTVMGRTTDGQWLFVTLESGQQGWVAVASVTLNYSVVDYAVAKIPSTPTSKPSPTLRATATRVMTPTLRATATVRATAPTASPWLLVEDFKDNRNGWPITDEVYMDATGYHLVTKTPNVSYHPSCTACGPWGDFAYEGLFEKFDGSDYTGYGLEFRRKDKDNYYVYMISGGYYAFYKNVAGEHQMIVDWTVHGAIIGSNVKNKLKVVARGSTFELYANDTLIKTVQDDTFSSGKIAIYVGNTGMNIRVEYLRVWRLQ